MERRQLQIFRQVALCASFTRASEKLHMAQPAVSIAVAKLEQELEVKLLNRGDRKIGLTDAGRALLRRAERILDEFEQASNEIKDLQALNTGEVKFDTPAMLGSYFFPEKLSQFRREYPNIRFQITGEGTRRSEQMLLNGETDMAIVNMHAHSDAIESHHLVKEEVVICVAEGHELAGEENVMLADLEHYNFILYHQGYHLRQIIQRLAVAANLNLNIVLETDLLRLMVSMVSQEMGIALCLRRLVQAEPNLCAVSFAQPEFIEMGIGWKRGSYLSRANRVFVDFLLES